MSLGVWWKQVKKGFELVKETVMTPLAQDYGENKTVCKSVNYGIAAGGCFTSDGALAKALTTAVGFGVTFAC